MKGIENVSFVILALILWHYDIGNGIKRLHQLYLPQGPLELFIKLYTVYSYIYTDYVYLKFPI